MALIELNLSTLFQEFDEILIWLREKAKIPDAKRFKEIKGKIEAILVNYDSSSNTLLQETNEKDLFLGALEAYELIEIGRFFKSYNQSRLPILDLRRVFAGPTFHTEEDPKKGDTDGRNIQFEFGLASALFRKGLSITGFEDIKASIENFEIEIQCKRPAFERNLKPNFDKAIKQLESSKVVGNGGFGFVAICLDKTFGLDQKLFRGNDIQGVIQSVGTHHKKAKDILQNQIRLDSRKNIVGVIYTARTIIWNKESGQFIPAPTISAQRTIPEKRNDRHDEVFYEFDKRIKLNQEND
jgi:hypothetical protein